MQQYDPLLDKIDDPGNVFKYLVMSGHSGGDDYNVILCTSILTEALKKAIEYSYDIYDYKRPNNTFWRNPWTQPSQL